MTILDQLLWWTGLLWWSVVGFVAVMVLSVAIAEWAASKSRPKVRPVDRAWLAAHGIRYDGGHAVWTDDRTDGGAA